MSKFKTGDIVQLKSGGPLMTVKSVSRMHHEEIFCQWYVGGKLDEGYFPQISLITIKNSTKTSKQETDVKQIIFGIPEPFPHDLKTLPLISDELCEKFREHGINTVFELLLHSQTGKERTHLEKTIGLPHYLLLWWVNLADLMRIPGINQNLAILLEAAGVNSVKEFKDRDADKLLARLKEVNKEQRLILDVPDRQTVENWIFASKKMEEKLDY